MKKSTNGRRRKASHRTDTAKGIGITANDRRSIEKQFRVFHDAGQKLAMLMGPLLGTEFLAKFGPPSASAAPRTKVRSTAGRKAAPSALSA